MIHLVQQETVQVDEVAGDVDGGELTHPVLQGAAAGRPALHDDGAETRPFVGLDQFLPRLEAAHAADGALNHAHLGLAHDVEALKLARQQKMQTLRRRAGRFAGPDHFPFPSVTLNRSVSTNPPLSSFTVIVHSLSFMAPSMSRKISPAARIASARTAR